jgi:RNA polymerase sigma factor (sigma-70 family)
MAAHKRPGALPRPWVVSERGEDLVALPSGDGAVAAAFDDFFQRESERLFRALYFVTASREDAEELMQDSFLKLWERWDRIDRIEDPTAYLFRVALNGFRSRVRHARVAARHLLTSETTPDPFDEVEVREDVRRLLAALTPRQRAALLLTDVYGYSSDHAARIMGIRAATVRVLASQGRAAIRTA